MPHCTTVSIFLSLGSGGRSDGGNSCNGGKPRGNQYLTVSSAAPGSFLGCFLPHSECHRSISTSSSSTKNSMCKKTGMEGQKNKMIKSKFYISYFKFHISLHSTSFYSKKNCIMPCSGLKAWLSCLRKVFPAACSSILILL